MQKKSPIIFLVDKVANNTIFCAYSNRGTHSWRFFFAQISIISFIDKDGEMKMCFVRETIREMILYSQSVAAYLKKKTLYFYMKRLLCLDFTRKCFVILEFFAPCNFNEHIAAFFSEWSFWTAPYDFLKVHLHYCVIVPGVDFQALNHKIHPISGDVNN